jgi:hypothetical protein
MAQPDNFPYQYLDNAGLRFNLISKAVTSGRNVRLRVCGIQIQDDWKVRCDVVLLWKPAPATEWQADGDIGCCWHIPSGSVKY